MNLRGLGKVEDYQTMLDNAFKNGNSAIRKAREQTISTNKRVRSQRIEKARVEAIANSLTGSLMFILKCFPMVDDLDPFYNALVKCTLDYDMYKKSLGAINWARKKVADIRGKYRYDIQNTHHIEDINKTRKAFSGRVSSVMKQIKDNLNFLDGCRKIMRSYPALKTSVNTIVVAGAPNVGKSTLLAVLTGSKPKTAYYPFTTKSLNLGYDSKKNQYIDTPGLLDRPLSERNPIERQAILALKHLAKLIIFVIDPTETCGYTIPQQRNLLVELKRRFKMPFIVVSNKADKGATFKNSIEVSATEGTGIAKLKKEINAVLSQTDK